jgi:hypothetical protein
MCLADKMIEYQYAAPAYGSYWHTPEELIDGTKVRSLC